MLIVTRALLGISGATLMPSTLALISNMFKDSKQRATAISVWMVCFSSGAVIGPAVGGILLEYFWWGSVFLLGVPVMLLLLVTGPWLLPEYRNSESKKLDPISVILSFGSLLPLIYGLKDMAKEGISFLARYYRSLVSVSAIGLSDGKRLKDPPLDLGLFAYRGFSWSLIMMLMGSLIGGDLSFCLLSICRWWKDFLRWKQVCG